MKNEASTGVGNTLVRPSFIHGSGPPSRRGFSPNDTITHPLPVMFNRIAALALALALPLAACGDDVVDNEVEADAAELGNDIEAGADEMGNDLENAGDAMEAEMNEAGDAMEAETDEAMDAMGEEVEETGAAMQDGQ